MNNNKNNKPERLLRLKEVLARYPVSKAGWYLGIQKGEYPRPIKLGNTSSVAWKESDIDDLIARVCGEAGDDR